MGGRPPVFVGPIGYIGHQALATDLGNFKAALATVKAEEGFISAVAPGSFARRPSCPRGTGRFDPKVWCDRASKKLC